MEFISLLILILFIWMWARFLGWVFNGPRHRRRVRERNYRRMQENLAEREYDKLLMYSERRYRRGERRRW